MLITKAPKGTQDLLAEDTHRWHFIEDAMRTVCALFGYREVRMPTFEHTELFTRSVGDTTDIVQKEMYTFLDKGGRSVTLKPEGTAGVARAFVEHGLYAKPLPQKMYYLYSPVFRYERPQAGRLREHHQFGIEVFGAASPTADAEVIALPLVLSRWLGRACAQTARAPKCVPGTALGSASHTEVRITAADFPVSASGQRKCAPGRRSGCRHLVDGRQLRTSGRGCADSFRALKDP